MTGIRVTPDQLQTLAGRVRTGAGTIDGELHSLAGSLAPLGGDWAGQAQAQFQALWADWQRNAKGLNEALQGIATLLQGAGAAYQQAEDAVASSFRY
jgi:WXG100 family type VII secretion target